MVVYQLQNLRAQEKHVKHVKHCSPAYQKKVLFEEQTIYNLHSQQVVFRIRPVKTKRVSTIVSTYWTSSGQEFTTFFLQHVFSIRDRACHVLVGNVSYGTTTLSNNLQCLQMMYHQVAVCFFISKDSNQENTSSLSDGQTQPSPLDNKFI